MNVIVSNKQKSIIDNANIDAIKDLNGLFSVDDLINRFKNYFFSKIILDATSVINFSSKDVLEKLVNGFGAERLVILLPSTPPPPKEFISLLNSLKVYNFSNNIEDVVRFVANPNTEGVSNDTATSNENFYVDNSIKDNNVSIDVNNGLNHNGMDNNIGTNLNSNPINQNPTNVSMVNEQDLNPFGNMNNVQNNIPVNQNQTIYNNTSNNEKTNYYDNNVQNNSDNNQNMNGYSNVSENNNTFIKVNNDANIYGQDNNPNRRVIGFKNVTEHAGSTTLVYLLSKVLNEKYKKRVEAVEVNKDDFKYFQDDKLSNINSDNLRNKILGSNAEIVLIDMNDYYGNFDFINEIIYLVEPSIIKLNKLMMMNKFAFRELQNCKVVLNKSLLSNSDVNALSKEAGVTFLLNIPPINDRVSNDIIHKLCNILEIK